MSVDRDGYRGALSGRDDREGIAEDKEPGAAADEDSVNMHIYTQLTVHRVIVSMIKAVKVTRNEGFLTFLR